MTKKEAVSIIVADLKAAGVDKTQLLKALRYLIKLPRPVSDDYFSVSDKFELAFDYEE